MSGPIEIGDLVQVVRACCDELASSSIYGMVAVVKGFNSGKSHCHYCGFKGFITWADFGEYEANVAWCRRIPPLDELESEKNKDEVTA